MNDNEALKLEHAAGTVNELTAALATAQFEIHQRDLTIAAHVKTIASQAEQLAADRRVVAVAGSDPMPKRTAFVAWCHERGLDTSEDKDSWGKRKFMHSHIESMWCGWFHAPASAPSVNRNSVLEEVAAHFDSKSRMCNPAYVSEFARSLKTAPGAAPQQVDAVQAVPEGWLIEWVGPDGTKYSELSRHNSVADYRYIDENATGTALVRAALASPSPAVPTEPGCFIKYNGPAVAGYGMHITGNKDGTRTARPLAGQAAQGAVPEGFALVPVIATKEMIDSGMRWLVNFRHMRKADRENALSEAFFAMLAAAPVAQPTDTTAGE